MPNPSPIVRARARFPAAARAAVVCLMLVVAVAGWAAVLSVPSCAAVDPQQAREAHAEADAVLAERRDEYRRRLEAAEAAGDAEGAAEARKALDGVDKLQERSDRVGGVLDRVITPEGGIDPKEVSRLLPYPFDLIALFGVSGVAWFDRQRKLSAARAEAEQIAAAARSIVNGLDAARAVSPGLKAAMSEAKATIDAQLTPDAKTLIKSETVT